MLHNRYFDTVENVNGAVRAKARNYVDGTGRLV
jgi:hypothetical protein